MSHTEADVCIVGSGAGGGPVALTLARAGFKVVVLEKGHLYKTEEFVHDEILNSRRNFFMPYPWEEPHLIRYSEHDDFERSNAAWLANCVGGGTVHMSGYFYRLKPVDFRMVSMLGKPAGSDVVDWPIAYEDLAPFYDQAEAELGVSGAVEGHPFAEPRSKPYPLPPLEAHPFSAEIDRVCKKLGLHPLTTARGIVSRDYQGRSGCAYCSLCGSYGCEVDAKSGTHVALIPKALETGNLDLRPRSMAKSIEVDSRGLAKSVVYLNEKGETEEQPAKVVVVSCSAIESARLLLNSQSANYPKGLSNNAGQVGRHLHFSGFGESRAHFSISARKEKWPWLADSAPFVLRSIQDWYVVKDQPFKKGGTLDFVWTHPNPIFAAQHLAGEGKEGIFGKAFKDKLREYRDQKILQFETYAEYLPNPKSFMDVDPGTLDKYGIPVARIQAVRHPHDKKMLKYLVDRGEEILKEMQPEVLERRADDGVTTILQGGTCRFGKDPATSVLDPSCRSHEVKNLYVVDGSFMPTSGGVTPTLTIVANGFRVGHQMVETLKRG